MPEIDLYVTPMIGLVGTLVVALVGFYQWRKQHAKPNVSAAAEVRRKAAEKLWETVEDIHIRLRTFGEDSRRIDLTDDLKQLNETFLKNSLYISDSSQKILNDYVKQLHLVAANIKGYQKEAVEWHSTILIAPDIEGQQLLRYRRINLMLEELAKLRVNAKNALLHQIDA